MSDTTGTTGNPNEVSGMSREKPEPTDSRAALVKEWSGKILEAKEHWKKDFKRMRNNMDLANGKQWPSQTSEDDRYVANFIQRVIKNNVSALYAKNPKVVAKRRKRMDFAVWDEQQDSLMAAMQAEQAAAQTGVSMPPQALALLQDVAQALQRRKMLDRIGGTLEILANYYQEEQEPDFKGQAKRMVRRARTTSVGYVEIDFQREMELSDDQTTKIADMTERLAAIGRMQADLQDGVADQDSAEAEELRLAIQALQSEPEKIVREGLIFTFPDSTKIIPSPDTKALMGWVGASWIAKELTLTVDRIKEVYGIDVSKGYTAYKPAGARTTRDKSKGLCCVWHVWDKSTGLEFVLCDGYSDFLQEPGSPRITVEQFFPIYALTFNEVEHEEELFPPSDVENLKHIQKEFNRTKESMRQHRIANRPLYVMPNGALDENEEKSMSSYAAHAVIKLNSLHDGQKAEDIIQPVKKIGVDPNLYETQETFEDMLRVTGFQEANLGGSSSATATQSSIAASSLSTTQGSDSDELDEFLTRIWRAAGQVLMMELSAQSVTEIAGPGAVWPELSRAEIMAEISLEVKAGSSGRPNQAQDAATFERVYPLLIQTPGIKPQWLAERAMKIADQDGDLADAYVEGLPSIVAMNGMKQQTTGNPANDPNSQGAQGGDKNRAPTPGGTAQPGYNEQPVGGPITPG